MKSGADSRTLVFGYGNPGRVDDGLGPALAEEIERRALEGVATESAYQLQIEDAERIAAFDLVVFADAHRSCAGAFEFAELEPDASLQFTTHAVAPAAILAMAHEHFASRVRGYLLGIRGVEFDEFGERLSARAQEHLRAAADHLQQLLATPAPSRTSGSPAPERIQP